MTRFVLRAMLILGVMSSGVLAAPTLTPRLPTEVEALQSSDSLIGGPRGPVVVNVLEARSANEHTAASHCPDPLSLVDEIINDVAATKHDVGALYGSVTLGVFTGTNPDLAAQWRGLTEKYRAILEKIRGLEGHIPSDLRQAYEAQVEQCIQEAVNFAQETEARHSATSRG
ncbi:hypothetical protein EV361DRAFT_908452 [Lentinula raphanica]|uniref:Secreted protein n=1 Tax=Lentinula raphanica TaxID=153919 RepID=A0AA38PJY8_9AGAR|nr:hypothetical protein F5878DRAFT_602897 [Lentinula raphanica]KAJ3971948.1 hypothetical protein EV361DRAFT_908452 [Lentinula raphanica]